MEPLASHGGANHMPSANAEIWPKDRARRTRSRGAGGLSPEITSRASRMAPRAGVTRSGSRGGGRDELLQAKPVFNQLPFELRLLMD